MKTTRKANPAYWGLLALTAFLSVLAYGGADVSTLTTWPALWHALVAVLGNPWALISIGMSWLGVTYNPTTRGTATLTETAWGMSVKGAPSKSVASSAVTTPDTAPEEVTTDDDAGD